MSSGFSVVCVVSLDVYHVISLRSLSQLPGLVRTYPLLEPLRGMYYRDSLLTRGRPHVVGDIRLQHLELQRCQSRILNGAHGTLPTWGVLPPSTGGGGETTVSCSSSSISVVSVPFEVTGDGPTMSLDGLSRCAECGRGT